VPEHAAADLLTRLERAFSTARRLGDSLDEAGVLSALHAHNCLPTRWVAELCSQRLNNLGPDSV